MKNSLKLRRSDIILLLVIISILGLAAIFTWRVTYKPTLPEEGKPASEMLSDSEETPYESMSGEDFSFTKYKGTIRVVNVWASWSPYTVRELPVLNQVAQEFKEQGVTVLAINRKEPRDHAMAYLDTLPDYPMVNFVMDETDAFYQKLGGYNMPETAIFDQNGDLVWHHRGVLTYEAIVAAITDITNQE